MLHFLPLARAFDDRADLALLALIAIWVVGKDIIDSGSTRIAIIFGALRLGSIAALIGWLRFHYLLTGT